MGSILIVEADISRLHLEGWRDEYLHLDEDQYADWREQLLDEDIDGIVADDLDNDLELCCVVLDHAKVRIIGSISADLSDADLEEIAEARPAQPGQSPMRRWFPGVEIAAFDGPWTDAQIERNCSPAY